MTQLFLFVNLPLLKCSICLLILRIKNTQVLKNCLFIMMAGLVLTNGMPWIVLLAECDPVQKYWIPATKGKCWNTKVRIYSIYVQVGMFKLSVSSDFQPESKSGIHILPAYLPKYL
jgi:hypothetical protein